MLLLFSLCYCNPLLEIYSGIFCFSSFNICGLFLFIFSLKTPQRQKSSGVRSGDWGDHTFWEIMLLPKNLCNICMCYRPFLLQLVELCITFQQGHEIHNLFVVKFCWYCFSGAKGADYSPFRHHTIFLCNSPSWEVQEFSAFYVLLLVAITSTKVKPWNTNKGSLPHLQVLAVCP